MLYELMELKSLPVDTSLFRKKQFAVKEKKNVPIFDQATFYSCLRRAKI